jgi:hypothetical protein
MALRLPGMLEIRVSLGQTIAIEPSWQSQRMQLIRRLRRETGIALSAAYKSSLVAVRNSASVSTSSAVRAITWAVDRASSFVSHRSDPPL